MQSIHSLNVDDRVLSNMAMKEVMKGSDFEEAGKKVEPLQTSRERVQRWLVNQRLASWTLKTMSTLTVAGVSCLVAWGLRLHNKSRSDWKRRVGLEVAQWMESRPIILGIGPVKGVDSSMRMSFSSKSFVFSPNLL